MMEGPLQRYNQRNRKTAAVKFMLRGDTESGRLHAVPAITGGGTDINTVPGKGRRNIVDDRCRWNIADGVGGNGCVRKNAEQAEGEKRLFQHAIAP